MVVISVGAVVFLPFPFSDLSQSKLRPAVVLASVEKDDWILCQVTSKAYADSKAIEILQENFETGSLKLTSYARPGKLFTANSSLIVSKAGELKSDSLRKIIEAINKLLTPKEEEVAGTESESASNSESGLDTESQIDSIS